MAGASTGAPASSPTVTGALANADELLALIIELRMSKPLVNGLCVALVDRARPKSYE